MRNKGTRNNKGTEAARKGLVHKGAEPRSEQKIILRYVEDGKPVIRLAGPPEFVGYHSFNPDWDV